MKGRSPKIILTADETMMSQYRGGMFLGFSTCLPRGILPDWLYFRLFSPPVPREDGRAVYADYGLRIIEASLLEKGFKRDEVAVVHPKDLEDVIGEETEVVGIGGHDILGINPPTSELVELVGTGPPYNRVKFLKLINKSCLKGVKVVVGGKSAWQVADEEVRKKLGIDHVHLGEGEISAPEMVERIIEGGDVPEIVEGGTTPVDEIPNIRGATIRGLVEVSRGCGRGCDFCTPGMQKLRHKPIDHILKEVRLNLDAGNETPLLHSEDVLRYGTKKIKPDQEKVIELFKRVAGLEGTYSINTSHIALSTVYHNPDLIEQISDIMDSLPGQRRTGTQTGIETGSARLIKKHMRGKALPSPPEKWPEIVRQSLGILDDNNWIPACTIINGLPGEREEDIMATLDLLDDLEGLFCFIVPLNFVSMEGSKLSQEDSFTMQNMTSGHWQILGKGIDHNVQIARSMKENYREGNPLTDWLFNKIFDHLIESAEKYAEKMKRGRPPRDYKNQTKNYLTPRL